MKQHLRYWLHPAYLLERFTIWYYRHPRPRARSGWRAWVDTHIGRKP